MPILQVTLIKGRTREQKREAAKKITEAVVETLKCPPDAVKISFQEIEKEDFASAGVLMVDSK